MPPKRFQSSKASARQASSGQRGSLRKDIRGNNHNDNDIDIDNDDTADDYLAAGVKQEEASEKWRAGDGAKSARFLHRALDTYERGLLQFPGSFDLVYNKARVLFTITQYPQLAAEFPASQPELLEASLAGHRRALTLDPDNADALFNTAQLLTALADASANASLSAAGRSDASVLAHYQEAVDLFQKCLAAQEMQFLETRKLAQAQDMSALTLAGSSAVFGETAESQDQPMDTGEVEDQWAAIVEPVTAETLADTVVACLDALSSLCSQLQSEESATLAQVERIGEVLTEKMQMYVEDLDADLRAEAILAHAKFLADVSIAHLRLGDIDLVACQAQLQASFEVKSVDTLKASSRYPAYLCAYADALLDCSSASDDADIQLQWSVLTRAMDCLTEVSKLPNVDDLVVVHLRRGDVELLRHGLVSSGGFNIPAALANPQVRQTLLKNANTYYRGAAAVANASVFSRGKNEKILECQVKLALVECLKSGNQAALQSLYNTERAELGIKQILREVVGEGLLKETTLRAIGISAV